MASRTVPEQVALIRR
ncbi:hypothetical protein ECPA32_2382, partial [Escherichia coli PA32]